MVKQRKFQCFDCDYQWEAPFGVGGSGREMVCPKCGSSNIHRSDRGRPAGLGRGATPQGRGRGRGGSGNNGMGFQK